MPINNGVFCNQIPLLFMDSADRVCIIPGLSTLRCRSRLSLYQGAHLHAPNLPQMFCNDTDSDKRDMSWDSHVTVSPLLSYSISFSWLLPNRTNSWWSISCDNKITAAVDDVMGVCVASLSFTEPHNHKASKYFHTIVFLCKYVLDDVLDRCTCVSHYLQHLTHMTC